MISNMMFRLRVLQSTALCGRRLSSGCEIQLDARSAREWVASGRGRLAEESGTEAFLDLLGADKPRSLVLTRDHFTVTEPLCTFPNPEPVEVAQVVTDERSCSRWGRASEPVGREDGARVLASDDLDGSDLYEH
jgi:hypothetical protein